jgi:hypothetical protein
VRWGPARADDPVDWEDSPVGEGMVRLKPMDLLETMAPPGGMDRRSEDTDRRMEDMDRRGDMEGALEVPWDMEGGRDWPGGGQRAMEAGRRFTALPTSMALPTLTALPVFMAPPPVLMVPMASMTTKILATITILEVMECLSRSASYPDVGGVEGIARSGVV